MEAEPVGADPDSHPVDPVDPQPDGEAPHGLDLGPVEAVVHPQLADRRADLEHHPTPTVTTDEIHLPAADTDVPSIHRHTMSDEEPLGSAFGSFAGPVTSIHRGASTGAVRRNPTRRSVAEPTQTIEGPDAQHRLAHYVGLGNGAEDAGIG